MIKNPIFSIKSETETEGKRISEKREIYATAGDKTLIFSSLVETADGVTKAKVEISHGNSLNNTYMKHEAKLHGHKFGILWTEGVTELWKGLLYVKSRASR